MDTRRLVLFVIFSMSILMLWDAWQRQNEPVPSAEVSNSQPSASGVVDNSIPTPTVVESTPKADPVIDNEYKLISNQRIVVNTDKIRL